MRRQARGRCAPSRPTTGNTQRLPAPAASWRHSVRSLGSTTRSCAELPLAHRRPRSERRLTSGRWSGRWRMPRRPCWRAGRRLNFEMTLCSSASPSRVRLFSDARRLAGGGVRTASASGLSTTRVRGRATGNQMQPPDGAAFHLAGDSGGDRPCRRASRSPSVGSHITTDVATGVEISVRGPRRCHRVALVQGPFKTSARFELHRAGGRLSTSSKR